MICPNIIVGSNPTVGFPAIAAGYDSGGIGRRIDKHYQVVKHDVNVIETMLDGIVM